ncbi:uncharacterized protein [Zea mays]|nr:uncharacterized protein LOC100857020 isoform X1 [Zea mays]|eukprot:XP_023157327.1 uncharacterized protein LOC100857020 isoform X1 [Zea mays]
MAPTRALPALWLSMAAAASYVVGEKYCRLCYLKGSSMVPTIQAQGDVGLLDRRCLAGYDFSHGDVVVFRSAAARSRTLLGVSSVGWVGRPADAIPFASQVVDGSWDEDGPEADRAAGGLDSDPGEAGHPAGPQRPLLGGRGQCRQQLGLETLWPRKGILPNNHS